MVQRNLLPGQEERCRCVCWGGVAGGGGMDSEEGEGGINWEIRVAVPT